MTDQNNAADEPIPKKPKLKLIFLMCLGLIGIAGGFYTGWSGLLSKAAAQPESVTSTTESFANYSYIPVDPIIISLAQPAKSKHLRFRAELEVIPGFEAEVTQKLPRIVDVLNDYLRAVDVEDLEKKAIIYELKRNMLHRISLVVGTQKVNSILVLEFVFT